MWGCSCRVLELEPEQLRRNTSHLILHQPAETCSAARCGDFHPPSAPRNTIADCSLPSGGCSVLKQTKRLMSRRNMGNRLPRRVRSTFQEISIDDAKIQCLCCAQAVLKMLLPGSFVGLLLRCYSAHPNFRDKGSCQLVQLHKQVCLHVKQLLQAVRTPLHEGLQHTRGW